jgi:hypothetical protein
LLDLFAALCKGLSPDFLVLLPGFHQQAVFFLLVCSAGLGVGPLDPTKPI